MVDPSGNIAKQLALVPLPNNFRAGDGLNTAGFTWSRPVISPNGLYEGRVDHLFNDKHRISIVATHQAYNSSNVPFPQAYPSVPGSPDPTEITSTLRPTLLNELRIGAFRPRTTILTPQDAKPELLSTASGVPYITGFAAITNPFSNSATGGASNRISPVYQYGDTMTWIRGRHAFKGSADTRFLSDSGFDAFGATPIASIGAGGVAVQNISTTAGPQRLAEQRFQSLTLSAGLRYEFYGVPTENQGKMLAPAGSGSAVFGISGSTFASEFQPGAASGTPTRIQEIGDGTPNPKTPLYNPDRNNFAPAVGLAWSLPWLGQNKTVIRAGYGIGYERVPLYLIHNNSGLEPGLSETDVLTSASLLTTQPCPSGQTRRRAAVSDPDYPIRICARPMFRITISRSNASLRPTPGSRSAMPAAREPSWCARSIPMR